MTKLQVTNLKIRLASQQLEKTLRMINKKNREHIENIEAIDKKKLC